MNKPTTHTETLFCRHAIQHFVNAFFNQFQPNERAEALGSINVLKDISNNTDDAHPLAKFREYQAQSVMQILVGLYLNGKFERTHSIEIDILAEGDGLQISVNLMQEEPEQQAKVAA
ncbi:hypothetical protein [Roseateles sp. PN1]|uniref:hypothetical protein n=1 Tax=Roseateles sp. PN1 TaxID=3137372 RepID=UPI00313896C6